VCECDYVFVCVRISDSVCDLAVVCKSLFRCVLNGSVRSVIMRSICVRSGRCCAIIGLLVLSSEVSFLRVSPVVGGMLLFILIYGTMRCRSASAWLMSLASAAVCCGVVGVDISAKSCARRGAYRSVA
jgi:hypothetical protein